MGKHLMKTIKSSTTQGSNVLFSDKSGMNAFKSYFMCDILINGWHYVWVSSTVTLQHKGLGFNS